MRGPYGPGPWKGSMNPVHILMDPVHGGGPWTRGPCFVLSHVRDLQIGRRVRDWVRVRLFNSNLQASHYHGTYPFHPMSYSLYLKLSWRTRALETSLVRNLKIVLVLNLVLVVQSEGPYFRANCLADWIASDACAIVFQLCQRSSDRGEKQLRMRHLRPSWRGSALSTARKS